MLLKIELKGVKVRVEKKITRRGMNAKVENGILKARSPGNYTSGRGRGKKMFGHRVDQETMSKTNPGAISLKRS